VWHRHADTDELFLVHRGEMIVRYRERDVVLTAGQLHVVPRGVEHMTLANDTCEVLVFEPDDTVNTGDAAAPSPPTPSRSCDRSAAAPRARLTPPG
jgi:mannose-6-phosphate isomerase-like protein (cupin superfamily)